MVKDAVYSRDDGHDDDDHDAIHVEDIFHKGPCEVVCVHSKFS